MTNIKPSTQTKLTPVADVTPVSVKIPEKEKSGTQWVQRFPGSSACADLEPTFGTAVDRFISALRKAGASVTISATYRPPERAYLMHWAWKLKHQKIQASQVPPMRGVQIEWDHGDERASIQAASTMVTAFGMDNLLVAPALNSRHTEGKAIDMTIHWTTSTLIIHDASDDAIRINSKPKNGMNTDLHKIGSSYGVVKFWNGAKDKPHWSTDGK